MTLVALTLAETKSPSTRLKGAALSSYKGMSHYQDPVAPTWTKLAMQLELWDSPLSFSVIKIV